MIGVVSDIHGNYPALEAVLDDMPDAVETLVCCGDIVGYGPHPAACVRTIRAVADVVVRGNHDRYVVDPRGRGIPGFDRLPRYARLALSSSAIRWLGSLPTVAAVDGYLVLHDWRTHGNADSLAAATDDLGVSFDEANGVLMGHTHRQERYHRDGKLFLNPGPVGEPRPSKLLTAPLAASLKPKYAVVDPERGRATFYRTDYLGETLREWVASLRAGRG